MIDAAAYICYTKSMEFVRVFSLKGLNQSQKRQLWNAQKEAARVWNHCMETHLQARMNKLKWPNRTEFQHLTKGLYSLHSQSVQMICMVFLINIQATRSLRKSGVNIRYPYKYKLFYPLIWPRQAIKVKENHILLPMGRSQPPILLNLKLPQGFGSMKIVFKETYELHVNYPVMEEPPIPGGASAAVDLGEVHQAAVSTDTGKAIVVSGRGLRTLKRGRAKAFKEINRKKKRCHAGSRRHKKLSAAGRKLSFRIKRRIRDLRHKGTRQVINFCVQEGVGRLFVGNPDGVRRRSRGRKHNQRMATWEYGKDIKYLKDKAQKAGIHCFTGSERGTSSQCPECLRRKRPKGRQWRCGSCGFSGHRDVVGSVNMHQLAFNARIGFPQVITYLRPGYLSQRRSSSLDTGQSCLSKAKSQPPGKELGLRVSSRLSSETG